jgi:phenylalanyl-tRNA synthetase beta chain
MKVSLKWLKDYVDVTVSASDLANRLTMAGNEVKAVETIGAGWQNVVIGQLIAINPHPNADRLRLATVDLGKEQRTVVCGAPNLNIGDKVVFASAGAELRDGHTGQMTRLKPAKIRGVESAGMLCSEMELGLSQKHEGILVLPVTAPLGTNLADYLGDSIIDLDVTPNRPDCLSVIGIAWEVAALTAQKVRLPGLEYPETAPPIMGKISVEILAPDLCPRYCAALVSGVKIGPSPDWMQERLKASGMRPINNIVDISNYVMLEYGQPLHTFDCDKLKGQKIIVRRAVAGEQITSLDGIDRKLTSDMLVIADAERAVAIAGVMGGANTEVTGQTADILIEAASFNPFSIRNTGGALNLSSEARYRFERGIASGLTLPALRRATQLLIELAGGTAAKGWIDVYPGQAALIPVSFSTFKLKHLLGAEFTLDEIIATLSSMGFECRRTSNEAVLEVIPPYWRSDIRLQEDLVEEIARIRGYDQIPSTLLSEPLPPQNPNPIFKLKRNLRLVMADAGFTEVLNFSLIGTELLKKLSPEGTTHQQQMVRVANPMTAEGEYLRDNLRATLLAAFAANRRFEDGSIRLFEVGKIYLKRNKDLPDERDNLCAVMGGLRFEKSWQDKDQLLDFFDAKGLVEAIFQRYGLVPKFEIGQDASLHPNKQAAIILEDTKIGVIGEAHPKVLSAFEITESVFLVELDLKSLVGFAIRQRNYQPVPRFPAIVRDMALIVDNDITHEKTKATIQNFPLVEQVEIFDVYSGGQLAPGKKSLAYRISYRSPAHTLTDEEVNQVQQQILVRLNADLKAVLRS